jgi:hypothetical protein
MATVAASSPLEKRIAKIDWQQVACELDRFGAAVVGPLLTERDCRRLAKLYDEPQHFRKRIVMARHGFGSGEYQYFADPLPEEVASLRRGLYGPLATVANRWNEQLKIDLEYPATLDDYRQVCAAAGQDKPTPLLLRYEAGDFNCLHQDLYGDLVFPLQVAILLDQPGEDFTGGEFVLTEQRPRMQSRAEVVPLVRGSGVIFPVHTRPVQGTKGVYRVNMRHGVSRLRSGRRHTLGIIFHDAKT